MRRALFPALVLLAATVRAATSPAPVSLSEPASAPARLESSPTPARFVLPEPTGRVALAAGANSARIEDKVVAGKATAYRFTAPAQAMYTIGVSAPRGGVWLAIFRSGSDKAILGATPEDKTIRLTTEIEKDAELVLVAYTEGAETPFRFEVSSSVSAK